MICNFSEYRQITHYFIVGFIVSIQISDIDTKGKYKSACLVSIVTKQLQNIHNNLLSALKGVQDKNSDFYAKFDTEFQKYSTHNDVDALNFKRSVYRWMNGVTFPSDTITKKCISLSLTRQPAKFGEIVIPTNEIATELIKNITNDLKKETNFSTFDIYTLTKLINNPSNARVTKVNLLQGVSFLLIQLYALQSKIFSLDKIDLNKAVSFTKILNLVNLDELTVTLRNFVYIENHITEQKLEKQVLIYLLDRISGAYLLK